MGIDAKQVEDPDHSEHSENDEAREIEKRQDSEEIHDAVKGDKKPQTGFFLGELGKQQVSCPDPQGILDAEYTQGDPLNAAEKSMQRGELLKGLKKHCHDIQDYYDRNKNIESTAGQVITSADLNDLKGTFFNRFAHITASHIDLQYHFTTKNSFCKVFYFPHRGLTAPVISPSARTVRVAGSLLPLPGGEGESL